MASSVFINEFHYDNDGTDAGEFIELAGRAGTNLTGWSLVLYNGANGLAYNTLALSGAFADLANGFGVLSFAYPSNGLQNGSPDGIALVDGAGAVVQFLSYEGAFTALDGPANGLVSTDIGVAEGSATPLGFSLQLTGTGDEAGDFTWAGPADDTPGAVNTGQAFTGGGAGPAPGVVVVQSDGATAVAEGGAGDAFTVVLAAAPTADVVVTLSVPGDVTAAPAVLTFTAANWNVAQQVDVTAVDDAAVEGAETVAIGLTVASADARYDGLAVAAVQVAVTDNDVALTAIPVIQGAGHTSALLGAVVTTEGIVTAVDSNGYYLQDAAGDGDIATSDAVFVFTSSRPAVAVGDAVRVTGTVAEFFPGGAAGGNLSTTQITATAAGSSQVLSSGNALPEAVTLGAAGRVLPTEVIEDDAFAAFDPTTDGIDFWESLEGMRVTVEAPLVVAPTNGFTELWVVADGGAGATNLSARGTLNIEGGAGGPTVTDVIGGDFNPERIQIDDDAGGVLAGFRTPLADVGDVLESVTGVVSYSFGNFEILATEAYAVAADGGLARETTGFAAAGGDLLVASYNVLNLDPNDADGDRDVANGQFARIAADIVTNLARPDIIALQEVQDGDGSVNSGLTSAAATLQALVDAIAAAGGPAYAWIDNTFIGDDTNGGQPGGNIRTAFLYNADRVDVVEGSLRTVTDPAAQQGDPASPFFDSRLPLVADFAFQGEVVTVVNNHFSSKGGSTPLYGTVQPPLNGAEEARIAQAEAVRGFVEDILAGDAAANVIVLGDLNEFEFEAPLQVLSGPGAPLVNLTQTLPEDERYTFIFEGNSQSLDHILVSGNLAAHSLFDAVHINSEFASQASDHDPLLALVSLGGRVVEGGRQADAIAGAAGRDLLSGGNGDDTIAGGGGADTVLGGNGADLLAGDGGADLLEGGNGADTLAGGAGDDVLVGGNGADLIEGGAGDDTLLGGHGRDIFLFGPGSGDDVVVDFQRADAIRLVDGLGLAGIERRDVDGDALLDTVVSFADGGSVTLLDYAPRRAEWLEIA
jgi:predicted extracellular nuclease